MRNSGNFLHACEFFQSAQGNENNIKIKMAGEKAGLNHVDQESENVSYETISNSESSYEEINLFIKVKKRKSKRGRKWQKSTWKDSTVDGQIDCICSNEYAKMKIVFTNNKASKNKEVYHKRIWEIRKTCEEREELYEYTLEQTRSKFIL